MIDTHTLTPEKKQDETIKVLWLSDTPSCATGFAQVARNLLKVLDAEKKYEFTIIGINHSDWYDQKKYPYRIYEAAPALTMDPRYRDLFGRQRVLDMLATGYFDVLFTLQDTFIIEPIAEQIAGLKVQMAEQNKKHGFQKYKPFKWIFYYPIDAKPRSNWITKGAMLSDFPVCYTDWGKEESIQTILDETPPVDRLKVSSDVGQKIRVIYHGVNTEEFFYVEDRNKVAEFRKKFFQEKADGKFLVVNINRNQPRKDLAKTLAAWSKFVVKHPNSFLYMHCNPLDVGGNLYEVSRNFGNLKLGENWSVPDQFNQNQGYPVEKVNMIYNCADAVVSTTHGEGWGLSYTEAMATKTLVIAPANSSAFEIVGKGEERGLLVKCGDAPGAFVIAENDNERMRPLVNVDHLAEQLSWAYENRDKPEYIKKIEDAYAWVRELDWKGEKIGGAWRKVFSDAVSSILKDKWTTTGVGRNDPCPCGSGKKYKHCHLT